MSCCGQTRASLSTPTPSTKPAPATRPAESPQRRAVAAEPSRSRAAAPAAVLLRHRNPGTLALRGPRSGRIYLFSDREPRAVDPEDAATLLRTGAVERA